MGFWTKLDQMLASHEIIIDRPKGSAHPGYPDMKYPLDYGYLKGTSSGDGNEIDVWRGSLDENRLVAIICTVDTKKLDAEIKLLIACSDDEIDLVNRFQNLGEFMSGIVVRRDVELT